MAQKTPKYGLEFSAGTVSLVRILAPGSFEVVDKAEVEDRDFSSKMAALHRVVSKDGDRIVTLPVFLRKLDTPVLTVRVEEDEDAQSIIHAAVEEEANDTIENLSIIEGEAHGPDQKVVYAKHSLLLEAKAFLAGFNFEPAYFAPRIRLADFPEDLRFKLDKPKKAFRREFAWGGLAAAIVLAFGYGMSNYLSQEPESSAPSLTVLSEPAQNIAPIPQKTASAATGKPADLLIFETKAVLTPVLKDMTLRFANETMTESVPISLAAVTPPTKPSKLDLFGLTGILGLPQQAAFNPQPIDENSEAVVLETGPSESYTAPEVVAQANETETVVENLVEDVTRAETSSEIQNALLEDISAADTSPDAPEAVRGNTLGDRPLLRPTELAVVENPTPAEETQTGDAIADDLLQQAIESDAERNENLENASRLAAVMTGRPPRKSNRWATNMALVLESKRVAAATIATESGPQVEAAAKPEVDTAVTEERDARRVSNTFRKNQLSLVGVVGAPNSRRAIFRTASGSIRTLKSGQKISGWMLVAIGESSVKVTRQGKEKTMRLP